MVMSPLLPRSARHPGRHVLAALALKAGASMVLQSLSGFHWAKELKTFYSQEFFLEFDFNSI